MDGNVAASASQWAADSNSAVCIQLISGETECSVLRALASDLDRGDDEPVEDDEGEDGGADVIQFHPVFTYPIYGEHERVFGYKGLRIKLSYAAGSLATYFEVEYDKRVEQMETTMPLRADDVDTPMRKILSAEAVCRTREEFAQRVARDTRDFQPVGQKVHEYRQEEKGGAEDGSEGLRYEIYESGFEDDEFRKYHRRMQTMVMFFIEGAQFIDDDERWRVFTVFERLELAGSASYSLVGFCTMYRFYHWPDQ
ncbi:histone acetyltransferase 1, partial [Coemansia biformis]